MLNMAEIFVEMCLEIPSCATVRSGGYSSMHTDKSTAISRKCDDNVVAVSDHLPIIVMQIMPCTQFFTSAVTPVVSLTTDNSTVMAGEELNITCRTLNASDNITWLTVNLTSDFKVSVKVMRDVTAVVTSYS